jgi:hypothetical protein
MPPALRVLLFLGNRAGAEERAALLRAAGFEVATFVEGGTPELRPVRKDPPDAFVVDLDRVPSRGRDIGLALRSYRDTRPVPLLFAGGEREKVAAVKGLLPDAVFTTWGRAPAALRRAVARPAAAPVKPPSLLAGYSGTPLPRKLGIKAGSTVALLGAPPGFAATLGTLPEGARLRDGARGRADLALWFVRSLRELESGIPVRKDAAGGELWICWPKKASGVSTDVTETEVRRVGLAAGLVDYKICAVDTVWSSLRFTRRKS